ncbi:Zinc finger protein 16 [Plakobranchus ocellatus]|uniref:Zinc finger protein 16 n=1 Tax=Plakobranchus ocellatus TaxID=259542 RepID=A0AAV4B969_9GAST|nr:Zinc finger protein 16 [Plakobranchus ocellatus]
MSEELLKTWEAFQKERQNVAGSCAFVNGVFSLVFDVVDGKVHELYRACGFSETQFENLHLLLIKVEQMCLFKLVCAFESFKLHYEAESMSPKDEGLSSAVTQGRKVKQKYSINNEAACTSYKKSESTVNELSRVMAKKKRIKESFNLDVNNSEMGRGKRKKIAKLQFDMIDEVCDKKEIPPRTEQNVESKHLSNCSVSFRNMITTESKRAEKLTLENQSMGSALNMKQLKTSNNFDQNLSGHGCNPETVKKEWGISSEKKNSGDCENQGVVHSIQANKQGTADTSDQREGDGFLSENVSEETVKVESGNICRKLVSDNSSNSKHEIKQFGGERTDFECDNLAPIICSICKEMLAKSRDLFKHWKKIHKKDYEKSGEPVVPPSLFYCEVCHESFDAPRRFKLHYRIHSGARPHACQVCGKKFRIFKGLMDHMMCHTKEKPFACPQCPKQFINKKLLNYHIKVHNNEIVPRVCEKCGKQYQTALGLKLHYRVHAGIRPHKCDVCGMAFTQRCSLQIHKRLHTGDKRHVCDVCGWKFNTNNALLTHRRVHTGERPYKCSECPFRAASSSCIKDHQIVHSKAKPFPCRAPGCDKYFKRQAHLMTHLKKKHSGLKPYSCTLCGAKFAMVSELTHHQKSDACDGGRIKKEASPEPEVKQGPPDPISDLHLVTTGHASQTVSLPLPDGKAVWQQEDDGPRIHGRKKLKPQQASTQVIQVTDLTEVPVAGEDQIVIQIFTESGAESTDVVLSEEEMAAILRLSQHM